MNKKCIACNAPIGLVDNFCTVCGANQNTSAKSNGKIYIQRKKNVLLCVGKVFKVYIDGRFVGKLHNGNGLVIETEFGFHELSFVAFGKTELIINCYLNADVPARSYFACCNNWDGHIELQELQQPQYINALSHDPQEKEINVLIDSIDKALVEKNYDPYRGDIDPLIGSAAQIIFETNQASVSILQRKLNIGYSRSARIVDKLEEIGLISSFSGNTSRHILMTRHEFFEELNKHIFVHSNNKTATLTKSSLQIIPGNDDILTADGRYDLTVFSQGEAQEVIDTVNHAKESYFENEFALGLYNESYGKVYKPRYVLFEIIIQLYKNSLYPDEQLAVALAYATQGAASRLKAIEYFEKCIKRVIFADFSKFCSVSALSVYSTFAKIYESEHLYEQALKYNNLACSSFGANIPYFVTKSKELKAKIQNPPQKRAYTPSAKSLEFSKNTTNAAIYFIELCGLGEVSLDEPEIEAVDTSFERIDFMSGSEFEEWCSELLRSSGFENVEISAKSGDQGVDILAEKNDITYAIQCKCYSHDLGNTPVQEINTGKIVYNRHIGAVMTNRYFTKGGKEAAAATGVLLWDRDKLRAMYEMAQQ